MIVLAPALALALALGAAPQTVDASATLTPAPGAPAATGQPLHWVVTLRGADAVGAVLDGEVSPVPEWAVLEGPVPVVDSRVPAAERPALQLRWTLMGLSSGELSTPALSFRTGEEGAIEVAAASITLEGALSAEEDAPRPLRGFREVEEGAAGDADLALVLLALLGAAGLAVPIARARARRPRTDAAAPGPSAAARVDALDAAADPAGTMAQLAPLVRRAVDEARGGDPGGARGALTDLEWAADLERDATLDPGRRAALAELVREASTVRFSGVAPSTFAAREAKGRAAEHLAALTSGAPGAPGATAPTEVPA